MMISDEDREIDIESDEDDGLGNRSEGGGDKRAHHNALERKRRDHIKDSFSGLRDAVPTIQGDKSSRAQILKKASEYIAFMRKKNGSHQKDIDDLKRQNSHLEAQIRALERAKQTGNFSSAASVLQSEGLLRDEPPAAAAAATPSDSAAAAGNVVDANGDGGAPELAYEGSGSDTSDGGGGAVLIAAPPGLNAATTATIVRTIQPGQSLLRAHDPTGPATKKFKI